MEEREKALFEVSIKAGEASSEIPLEGGKKKKKTLLQSFVIWSRIRHSFLLDEGYKMRGFQILIKPKFEA